MEVLRSHGTTDMKHLFSAEGKKILSSFCTKKTLYAFDYDGTLSRIVNNPKKAVMPTSTSYLLKQLSMSSDVAVISGRHKKDLRKVMSFRPKYVVGNHGIESGHYNKALTKKLTDVVRKWNKELVLQLDDGTEAKLENKKYSLTVHYRAAKNKQGTKEHILTVCKKLKPSPRIILGKCVVNLIPTETIHKGTSLLWLMEKTKSRRAVFVGDDDTDEDVFRIRNKSILMIRVGYKNGSKASYYIKKQIEINNLLRQVLKNIS